MAQSDTEKRNARLPEKLTEDVNAVAYTLVKIEATLDRIADALEDRNKLTREELARQAKGREPLP